ncbi:MAG: TIGR03621 family F420-dependent LLM class oxidoreductase [Ilumatobacteraceae bacterium]
MSSVVPPVTHPRRFRFGVEMMHPFEGMSWVDTAREVESLGYSTLFVPDHFHEGFGPISAMTAAAVATTTLHVAPMVFACDFRHPAVVARELASIDIMSAGRLEVGLGAGYQETDYFPTGIAMDSPGVRVSRLIEHTTVLRGLFGPEPLTFEGDHYRITALDGTPKPHRPGGPPILIAGGGKRLLTFAAQAADIIGVNPSLPSATLRGTAGRDALTGPIDEKFEWIRAAAGDRFDSLEVNAWMAAAVVTGTSAEAEAIASKMFPGFGAAPEDVLASPIVLVGTETQITERLHERRERWGYSYHVLPAGRAHQFSPLVQRLTGT